MPLNAPAMSIGTNPPAPTAGYCTFAAPATAPIYSSWSRRGFSGLSRYRRSPGDTCRWPRGTLGCKGTYIQPTATRASGGLLCSSKSPCAGALNAEKHLYEKVDLRSSEGRGSTR